MTFEEGKALPRGEVLFAQAYERLRGYVHRFMALQERGRTLQPTEVLHEAFLRVRAELDRVEDEAALTRLLASVFAHVVIDHARERAALKRGGDWARVPLDPDAVATETRLVELSDLGDALERLAREHPDAARVFELYYFAGLTYDEVAANMCIARTTAFSFVRFAQVFLKRELNRGAGPS